MNELEITIWSMWLDKLGWDMRELSLDNFLIVTAIQSKEYLNDYDEMKIYLKKVNEDYPGI